MRRFWNRLVEWLRAPARVRRHVVVALAVLTAALGLRLGNIGSTLPYPQHIDETMLSDIALGMMRTGNLNPHDFRKPSLSMYLIAGGFSVGLAHAKLSGDARDSDDLGRTTRDYYRLAQVAAVPKAMFAIASVLALGLIGYVGYLLSGEALMLWLVPLIASLSPSYYRFSWWYMNVDVLGAFFAVSVVAFLLRERVRQTLGHAAGGVRAAVIAGVLAGLTVGSKYNLFPILVPCVLWFAFFEPKRFLPRVVTLGGASLVTFLLTTPYALLDYRRFFRDVLREVEHYATGHPGVEQATVEPGLPMVGRHIELFAENFGFVLLLISLVGYFLVLRREVRMGLVVVSYPVVFVGYMCAQKVFFQRNVVAVHLFIALGIAIGLREIPRLVARAVTARRPSFTERRVQALCTGLLIALAMIGFPWKNFRYVQASSAEPRNQAAQWIEKNVRPGTTVLVDEKLGMDVRPLKKRYNVVETDPKGEAKGFAKLTDKISVKGQRVFVVSSDEHRDRYSKALGDRIRTRFVRSRTRPDGRSMWSVTILELPKPEARRVGRGSPSRQPT
jgi:hypothetical protein